MISANKIKYLFRVIVIAFLLAASPSCKTTEKLSPEVKEAEKALEDEEKQMKKEYEAAVKTHRDQQSDYAKKLMKDMKKQRKKNNKIRERSIWDRIFRRNCS